MSSNDSSSEEEQCVPEFEEFEENTKVIEEPKIEDREWQLNKSLAKSMITLYDKQLWTDVTFRFEVQVS